MLDARVIREALQKGLVRQCLRHFFGDAADVGGIEKRFRKSCDLWDGGDAGGNNRRTAAHGFQNGQPKSLVQRGKDEETAGSIERAERFV